MNIISGVYWDKGKQEHNQDSLMLEQVYTRKGRVLLAVVSDGIGGLPEGETASGIVVEKLLLHFYQEALGLVVKGKTAKRLEKSFRRCFYEINQLLNHYGKSREIRLGTTVSLLFIWRKQYLLMHLGDSRIWQIRNLRGVSTIKRMTRIHADDTGRLLRCMGSFAYQKPDIRTGKIMKNTGFLLSTDGFCHFVRETMFREVLNPVMLKEDAQIGKRLKQLADYGTKQGESDNSSAIYFVCK